jgi:tetratricopeptide (TPR) repeat protein
LNNLFQQLVELRRTNPRESIELAEFPARRHPEPDGIELADAFDELERPRKTMRFAETSPPARSGAPRIRPAAYETSTANDGSPRRFALARHAFEEDRHRSTAHWGALSLDSAWSAERVWTSSSAPYRTLGALLEYARTLLENLGPEARYYSFHSGLGTDLVIEIENGEPLATRLTLRGRETIQALPAEQERVLGEDAALREVAGVVEEHGLEAAYLTIERALTEARGRRELLPVAVDLIRVGKYTLASSIIGQRLALAPNDVNALMLDARITINLVREGLVGPEHLASADARFARVLELEPKNLRGLLMWSELPRFSGDPRASIPRYATVLERFPGCEVAHYNLASLLLACQPEDALAHFSAGERLCPEDADYPIGRARALLALGRLHEAGTAAERARQLAPSHPQLASIEQYTSLGMVRKIA